jgi:hypothetical protein
LEKNPETRLSAQQLIEKDEIKAYIQKLIDSLSSSDKLAGLMIKN